MTTPTSLTNGPPLGLARLRAPARFTGEGVTPVRASSTRSGSPLRMHARLQIDYRICGRREGGHSCPFVSSDGGMRRVSVRINQSETLRINRHKAGSRRESHGYSLLGKGRFTFVPRTPTACRAGLLQLSDFMPAREVGTKGYVRERPPSLCSETLFQCEVLLVAD